MPRPDGDIATDEPRAGGELTEIAHAKVNLALHVREKRADGYHALESLFVFVRDGDLLTGREAGGGSISLEIDGPFGAALDAGADNLVVKAAHALQDHLGEARGAALRLTKKLPVASGIGGGSADAAAALRLLNRLWGVGLPNLGLERIALTLGSDVPACISSVTQMVRGRGEMLEPRAIEGLAGRAMLLVNPAVAVSTARVFAGWDQKDRGPLLAESLDALISEGRNDLEQAAIEAAPEIDDVLARLGQCKGVRLARMSGSGATCFALFDDVQDGHAAAVDLRAGRPHWWVMETEIRTA
ncbi:MAG TPA: 4-(cytidine 5'-diphospho)-2-C-methyl-D-erythritol kinase [Sphingobium sp.]